MNLEEIYTKYHKEVFAICYYHSGKSEEAEEVTQEAFIKLDKYLKASKDPIESVKSWLFKVAINTSLDRQRSSWRFKRLLESAVEVWSNKRVGEIQQLEMRDEIKELLGMLDSKTRMVLILKYMQDLKYSEIQEITGIKENTLKSLVNIALKMLRIEK